MKEGERPKDLPEIVGGRYRVLTNLGQGAMGRVFKVEHLHTGETLALKLLLAHRCLDPSMVERFRREARSLASVRSEHVVRIIDADISPELDSAPYIVMEFLHGENLGHYAARRGPLDSQEVVALLEQVARGLQRVHKAGLAHRDLKPANIFLHHQDDRLVIKLLDFGLVKPTTAGSGSITALTQEGILVGTPQFMSPEQVQGIADAVGPPTDIWAVGIIAFHLLTGRPYWNLSSLPRGVLDIGATALIPPSFLEPALSVAFDSWFLRSCARNPSARWPDPQTQWQELARALGAPAIRPAPLSSSTDATAGASGTQSPEEEATRSATLGSGEAPTTAWQSGEQIGPARQRRQVTVLFYRLVHGDRRTHTMDPEEFETLDIRIQTALDEALGDLLQTGSHLTRGGRFVFFGYPVAYGDDARRAVEAGLRLIEVTRGLDAQLRAEGRGTLRIRLGAHTGLVLTGNPDLVGPALSVAAELEHQAAPGQLLVSAATWRLLGGRFRGERLGSDPDEEMPYVVLGPAHETASGAAALMVGRNAELALLLSCLEEARYGTSQTVLVTGEVGIGKSRLVRALRETALAAQMPWLECHCSPYFQRTPFHPLVVLVKNLIQQAAGRTEQKALGATDIQAAAKSLAFDESLTPVVEILLSLPPTDPSAIEQWSPQFRRERTIATLISLLHHRAAGSAPLIFVVEDLHWADPSTLEFLDRLSIVGGAPLLTVLTARPDFAPSWSSPSAFTPVQLRRLPPPEAARLIAQLSGRDATEKLVAQLVRLTDGNPLFIEEAARALTELPKPKPDEETKEEKGSQDGDLHLIGAEPTTLRDALNARLDRLGTARGLAQAAAVLGPEFEVEDLRALWSGDPSGFQAQLRELVRLKVLQPRGLPPHAGYTFQHALLRDAAYDSLPREARRDAHRQIAQTLGSRKTGLATRPELLAHHFAEGGMAREAAGLLLQAGQGALRNSANVEARSHFQRGIDLLSNLEQTPADATLDITLRTIVGMTWVVSRGYAVPEVEQSFAGAMARVRGLNEETPELLPALWAQWQFLLVRGNFREAAEASSRLLRLADRFPEPGVAMLANLSQGTTLHGLGRFEAAVAHLEEGARRYDPEAHAGYRYVYGQDPLMFGYVFEAWAVWCLGYPDRAAALADRARAHAERLRHPNSLGFALAISAIVRHYRGEAEAVARLAQALLQLSTEQGWIQWLGHAQLWSGAADVLQGQVEKGVAAMREARHLAGQAGEKSGGTHYESILIDGLCRAGLLDEAAARIAKAKEQLAISGEYAFEADLLRLEGEVARLRGDPESARQLFGQALASATARKSRSYELRASLSLARLERSRGADGTEERARLARVLGEFTEGFDTADLRAARAEVGTEEHPEEASAT